MPRIGEWHAQTPRYCTARITPGGNSVPRVHGWRSLGLWLLLLSVTGWALRGRWGIGTDHHWLDHRSPAISVGTVCDALEMAEDMLLPLDFESQLWCAAAVRPLTALLYAFSPAGNGQGWDCLIALTESLCLHDASAAWDRAAALVSDVDVSLSCWVSEVSQWEARQRDSLAAVVHQAVSNGAGLSR